MCTMSVKCTITHIHCKLESNACHLGNC